MKTALKSLPLLAIMLTSANAHALNFVRVYGCEPERALPHAPGITVTFRTTGLLPNAGHYCTVEIGTPPGLGHAAIDKKVEMTWDEGTGEWEGAFKGTSITAYEIFGKTRNTASVTFGIEAYNCEPVSE